MKLYGELAAWWPLMSPPEEYVEEATALAPLLAPAGAPERPRLLELGCGGGHLASHLKVRFDSTLVDLSPAMLALSRRLNPDCAHLAGDMRTLRLEARFDAVLIHDAVSHMATEGDLRAAMATARAHLRAGGIAVFCPDATAETFRPGTTGGGTDGAGRGMRYLEWTRRGAGGTTCETDIAYLLREPDGTVRVEHDHAELGLFSRAQWRDWIVGGGFDEPVVHEVSARDVFVARA